MKRRTHRQRNNQRIKRLEELVREHQVDGKRFGNHWRINKVFDYWPKSGRVLDRRDPKYWTEGHVSGPDELVDVVRGVQKLQSVRVTCRREPWSAPWVKPVPHSLGLVAGRELSGGDVDHLP